MAIGMKKMDFLKRHSGSRVDNTERTTRHGHEREVVLSAHPQILVGNGKDDRNRMCQEKENQEAAGWKYGFRGSGG